MLLKEITAYLMANTLCVLIILQNEACQGVPVCLWCSPADGAVSCRLCTRCLTPCTSCTSCTPFTTDVQNTRTLTRCTTTKDNKCHPPSLDNGFTEPKEQVKNQNRMNTEKVEFYRQITDHENGKSIRHHRVIRSSSNSNNSDDVSDDVSHDSSASSESDEDVVDVILKDEGLFVHSEASHVIYSTSEPGHDDLDIDAPERGSGEPFTFSDWPEVTSDATAVTPSDDLVTESDWTATTGDVGELTSSIYDVTIDTTDVADFDNVTGGVTENVTEDVTEDVTDYDEYELTVTLADDEFDRAPFTKRMTSPKPDHIASGKSANGYHLTEVNVGDQEVVGSSSSANISNTSIIITVIVIVVLCLVGVIIVVIYRRKQKRMKKTQRNGGYHPASSEERNREMEPLNGSRDENERPDGSTETTPLKVDAEPEVSDDLLMESKT